MNDFIQFIRHGLGACFFMSIIGSGILYIAGYEPYILGWLWGIIIMMLYILLLGAQLKKYMDTNEPPKTGMNMLARLVLVGSFTVVGLQFSEVYPFSMGAAVIIMQPVLFVVYWMLSKKSKYKIDSSNDTEH